MTAKAATPEAHQNPHKSQVEVKTQSFTKTHGKSGYFSLSYAPETAAGLLELNLEQLYGFMNMWGRPLEDPQIHVRREWYWNVCWLDFVQCLFLTDLGFQQDLDAAERLITELCHRFEDRYPTAMQQLWEEEGKEVVWEIQHDAELPTELFIVEVVDGELTPTKKAQQFLNRATYDDQGIIEELILLHPNTPGDQPILIKPGHKSGYPTIRSILIEFIGPLYHIYGLQEVMDTFELNGLTETEAKAVAEYTATHYIEPMPPESNENQSYQPGSPPKPT